MTNPPRDNDSTASREGATADDVCSVLANEQCRSVLYYFQESTQDVVSVEDLAAFISERNNIIVTREQATIVLQHIALPKLEDAGIIEYDERSSTVRYRGHPQLESIVRLVAEIEDEM